MVASVRSRMSHDSDARDRGALIAALRRQVERALSEERWRFADYFCDKILAEDPRDLQAWLMKGHLANHRFKDFGKAITCYRQVLVLGGRESLDPTVREARSSLTALLERYS